MTTVRPSVVPDLIDALVARCTLLLPGTEAEPVTVCDGYAMTNNAGTHLLIGVARDIVSDSTAPAVTGEQTFQSVSGRDREETGLLGCAIYALEGGRDDAQKVARDRAYGVLATIETDLRDNPRVALDPDAVPPVAGVPGLLHLHVSDVDYRPGIGPDGVEALVSFNLSYRARI